MCSAPRGALAFERNARGREAGGGRLFPGWGVGGHWTKRVVSSSVRRNFLWAAKSRTSQSCRRRAYGMKTKRSVAGGGTGAQQQGADGVAAHRLDVFSSRPVLVGVVLDESEEGGGRHRVRRRAPGAEVSVVMGSVEKTRTEGPVLARLARMTREVWGRWLEALSCLGWAWAGAWAGDGQV